MVSRSESLRDASPRRMLQLESFLGPSGSFGDWSLGHGTPLTDLFAPEEVDTVEPLLDGLRVIGGSSSGGSLILDTRDAEDIEKAPVVELSSEAEFVVLGTSFDDFLALVACPDYNERGEVAPEIRRWIGRSGIKAHKSASKRLGELATLTAAFRERWEKARKEKR